MSETDFIERLRARAAEETARGRGNPYLMPEQVQAALQRFVAGESYDEIAKSYGVPRRVIQYRVRKALRQAERAE